MSNSITNNRRTLWLAYETAPHPDAVSYAADEADVRLALGLLAYPWSRRAQLADRIRKVFSKISKIPPFERPGIPARMPNGIYRPIPWRFAQWLMCVLRCEATVHERLTRQLESWLHNGPDPGNSTIMLRNQSAQCRA